MDSLSYKTQMATAATAKRNWVVVDATGQTLGRLTSQIAMLLRGKHRPDYTPHVDCGDRVIVINAEKIVLTGKKWQDKEHLWHTGYPGGQRTITMEKQLAKNPAKIIEVATKGMLPKTKLGSEYFRNLYVYAGGTHPHQAQNPEVYTFGKLK